MILALEALHAKVHDAVVKVLASEVHLKAALQSATPATANPAHSANPAMITAVKG